MNHSLLNTNVWIWFWFVVYVIATLTILPNQIEFSSLTVKTTSQTALNFACRFMFRIVLIFPMIFFIKNFI